LTVERRVQTTLNHQLTKQSLTVGSRGSAPLAIFVCGPASRTEEASCAKQILSTLALRAYRRPVTDADLQPLLSIYNAGRTDGGFNAGIEQALERILVSLQFLFRIERDPAKIAPNTVYRISDLELASRLSFFLWSSIPDDELLDVAVRGKLKDPAVLEQQVRRMLADAGEQLCRTVAVSARCGGQDSESASVPGFRLEPERAMTVRVSAAILRCLIRSSTKGDVRTAMSNGSPTSICVSERRPGRT
jgi:hypothetical protein